MLRFLYAWLISAALAGQCCATTILETLGGPIPDARDTVGLSSWCDNVAGQLRTYNDETFAGATTYYVDSVSGNDSNAGTSQGAPWASLTKLNLTTDASGAAINVKIKRGSIFRVATGIKTSRPCAISDYGAGAPWRLTRCVQTLAGSSGSWVNSSGTTYYCPNSAFSSIAVGMLVVEAYTSDKAGNPWERYPFFLAANVAECESNAYSYYYDSGTSRLYVNFGTLTKNNLTFGLTDNASTADEAIEVKTGTGALILEGGLILGWEERSSINVSNATNGIWLNDGTAAGTVKIIRGMEFWNGGRHHVTFAVGSAGANQCVAVLDSNFGYESHYSEAQIVFDPADAAKPTADLFVSHCNVGGGFLPSSFVGPQTKANGVFVGRHGDTVANAGGAIIVHRCTPYAASDPAVYPWAQLARMFAMDGGHIPATSWTSTTWNYKQLVVNCPLIQPWSGGYVDPGAYQAIVNSPIVMRPNSGTYSSTYGATYSAIVNGTVVADLRNQTGTEWGWIHLANATPSNRMHGVTLAFANTAALPGSQRCGIYYESAIGTYTSAQMAAATCQFHDLVVVAPGSLGTATKIGATNRASHFLNLMLGENIAAIGSTTTAAADSGNLAKTVLRDFNPLWDAPVALAGAGGATRLGGDVFGAARPVAASPGGFELAPLANDSTVAIAEATRAEIDADSTQLATIVDDGVTVASLAAEALAQFVADDTGETAAVDGSVADLSGGAGGGGSSAIERDLRAPSSAFTFTVSRRSDGTYGTDRPLRFKAGESIRAGLNMAKVSDVFVYDVGAATVSSGGPTVGSAKRYDKLATVIVSGSPTAGTYTFTIDVTMEDGDEIEVVQQVVVP